MYVTMPQSYTLACLVKFQYIHSYTYQRNRSENKYKQTCNSIRVPFDLVRDVQVPDVPDFDDVVQTPGDDFLSGVVEDHSCDWESAIERRDRVALARVPDLYRVVVRR